MHPLEPTRNRELDVRFDSLATASVATAELTLHLADRFAAACEDRVRLFLAMVLRLARRIDSEAVGVAVTPLGIRYWWGLPGGVFAMRGPARPIGPFGGLLARPHALTLDFDAVSGCLGRPWSRTKGHTGTFPWLRGPLQGGGGRFEIDASGEIRLTTDWLS